MKSLKFYFLPILFSSAMVIAQKTNDPERYSGHKNENKFKELYDEFATPNMFRTGSGAPGPAYYQQQADYKMSLELDDANSRLSGYETITYTNNSPDELKFLWIQLDQNMRAPNSKSPLIEKGGVTLKPSAFAKTYMKNVFKRGFNIEKVLDVNGKGLEYMINGTMMRIELPNTMKTGDQFSFDIQWWYNINNHVEEGGRSGYEYFADTDNKIYVMAQFYPRMAVYNDVEGWQNAQFFGRDEFALPFGDFEVDITVPADHILDGTGELVNRKEVFTKKMMEQYKKAQSSYNEPVVIVSQQEALEAEKSKSNKTKTWKLHAKNVRDFGWASSRKFIWDMMAVNIGDKDVMAVSMYPSEANPLWGDWSTKTVASTLISYSRMTFDYPYHKAISVSAPMGMEYPMICYNFGRPDKNGVISRRVRYGMMGVIIHEVGHNFFPMIINSDERQWTWMDEGLNSFVQYVAQGDFGEKYPDALADGDTSFPSRRGPASKIISYMSGNQDFIAPIMTKGLNTYQFGNNAYGKPATALNILRETIMGRELFDYSFKTYANRWKFKHPTPEDFFRTMEDASAMDLDWFWRGWFYTTDVTDIGLKDVKKMYVTSTPGREAKIRAMRRGQNVNDMSLVFLVEEGNEDLDAQIKNGTTLDNAPTLKEYLIDNFSPEERENIETPKYFYNITFDKPGGLVMPIIVQYAYADGTKEKVTYPAQIWRFNDSEVSKIVATNKEIISITIDPDLETADIDTSNNSWPKEISQSKFERFKNKN